MSESEKILYFSKNPNTENASSLKNFSKILLFSWSVYCIEERKGNVELAKKFREILIPLLRPLVCLNRAGLKSLLSAIEMLSFTKPVENNRVIVFLSDNSILNIYRIIDIITEKIETKGKKKIKHSQETILYQLEEKNKNYSFFSSQDLKNHVKDFFREKNNIEINQIILILDSEEKIFYDKNLGIVWKNEKCAECTKLALDGTLFEEINAEKEKECRPYLKDKCWKNFINGPNLDDNVFLESVDEEAQTMLDDERLKKIRKQAKIRTNIENNKFVFKTQNNEWQCKTCYLTNNGGTQCISCESIRE